MRGIYVITNKVNNKVYIGQTENIELRFSQHLNMLRANRRTNKHMQNVYNKYGEENFVFDTIYIAEKHENLNHLERIFISLYKTNEQEIGYNKTNGGEGYFLNDEIKNKISFNSRGKNSDLDFNIVRRIKMAIACGMDRSEVADLFKINKRRITDIVIGKNFYYVNPELNDVIHHLKQEMIDRRNMSIVELYDNGLRICEICKLHNLSESVVEKAIYKYRHTNKNYKLRKICKNDEPEIVRLYFKENISSVKLAKLYNVSSTTIISIINDYKYLL